MATPQRAFFSWIGSQGGDMAPGAQHHWWMTGFKYGDPFSVTAHPVVGDPNAWHRILMVDFVRVDGTPTGPTLRFRVTNVGGTFVVGYGVGIGWIAN